MLKMTNDFHISQHSVISDIIRNKKRPHQVSLTLKYHWNKLGNNRFTVLVVRPIKGDDIITVARGLNMWPPDGFNESSQR